MRAELLEILKEVYAQGYLCGIMDDEDFDEYIDRILALLPT